MANWYNLKAKSKGLERIKRRLYQTLKTDVLLLRLSSVPRLNKWLLRNKTLYFKSDSGTYHLLIKLDPKYWFKTACFTYLTIEKKLLQNYWKKKKLSNIDFIYIYLYIHIFIYIYVNIYIKSIFDNFFFFQ